MGKQSYFPMKFLTVLNFLMLLVIFVIVVMTTVTVVKFMNSMPITMPMLSNIGSDLNKINTMSDEISNMNAKINAE